MFLVNTDLQNVKAMFKSSQDLLLINHGLVTISGVKSPVMSHMLIAEAIRSVKMVKDKRFVHIIRDYTPQVSLILSKDSKSMTNLPTYDEPTHWLRPTYPRLGQVRQFYFFCLTTYIYMATNNSIHTTITFFYLTISCARKDLYNHTERKNLTLHLILKKLMGLKKYDELTSLSPTVCHKEITGN